MFFIRKAYKILAYRIKYFAKNWLFQYCCNISRIQKNGVDVVKVMFNEKKGKKTKTTFSLGLIFKLIDRNYAVKIER